MKPSKQLDLKQGEKAQIEIISAVRRSKGIIKIDAKLGREIAESDEFSCLES